MKEEEKQKKFFPLVYKRRKEGKKKERKEGKKSKKKKKERKKKKRKQERDFVGGRALGYASDGAERAQIMAIEQTSLNAAEDDCVMSVNLMRHDSGGKWLHPGVRSG